MSLRVERVSSTLRALLLLVWLIAWVLYWFSGRDLTIGLILLAMSAAFSIALIGVAWVLWGRYDVGLAPTRGE